MLLLVDAVIGGVVTSGAVLAGKEAVEDRSVGRQVDGDDAHVDLDVGPDGEGNKRPEDVFVVDEYDKGDANRGCDAGESVDE